MNESKVRGKPDHSLIRNAMRLSSLANVVLVLSVSAPLAHAQESDWPDVLIGYTELQTNLPGGRHANVRTMRAMVCRADGSQRRTLAEKLASEPDAWTQFAGWSPDGQLAIVGRGWQDPENARWEEEHRAFRMEPGNWLLDSCLVDLATGDITNVTAVDRMSHYNSGLFYRPKRGGLGFTALIDGVSKPFVMDLDGRNKRAVSDKDAGFTYGYSASPDGELISFHENYQVYVANADGTDKKHIVTGNPFDFAPQWSPDGQWLLFVSGEHGRSHPHVVRRDGSGLRKLADLNGYEGSVLFLDVEDFHQGSSDLPSWSADGKCIYYTAKVDSNTELFAATVDGTVTQLTTSDKGSLHYHPQTSRDGKWLVYGSKRNGVRQLFVMSLADRVERGVTDLSEGRAAMWPHWQPSE